jgi:hypothetical protein
MVATMPFARREVLAWGAGALAAASLHPTWTRAGRGVRRVVLIALAGGVRTRDTFGAPGGTPSLRALAEQGVLYTRVRSASPGHSGAALALFTGVEEPRGLRADGRGPDPTLFEYARQAAGSAGGSAWLCTSEPAPRVNYGCSLHGDYGPRLGAEVVRPGAGGARGGDRRALEAAEGLLARGARGLIGVVLHEADVAHRSYRAYVDVLRRNDAAIGRLWAAIRADRELRDSTALIVLPEFGRDRELNSRGGLDHGDGSEDSRFVAAAAWGPGFARGRVVRDEVRAIDVCPTVCELLGAAASHARGSTLPGLWA